MALVADRFVKEILLDRCILASVFRGIVLKPRAQLAKSFAQLERHVVLLETRTLERSGGDDVGVAAEIVLVVSIQRSAHPGGSRIAQAVDERTEASGAGGVHFCAAPAVLLLSPKATKLAFVLR